MDVYDRRLEDLKQLVQHSDLKDIQFHELSAKLYHEPPEPEEQSAEAQVDLSFQTRTGDDDFGVRVAVDVVADAGEAHAIVAAEYTVTPDHVPDEELLRLFATEVAMLAAFPYIREGVQSATMRVFGKPLTLPIMRRGEITVDQDGQD